MSKIDVEIAKNPPKNQFYRTAVFWQGQRLIIIWTLGGPTKVVLRTVRYRHTVHKVRYHANSCLM